MPISTIFFNILGLGFLLLCSSFFSGSETALSALTMPQIQRLKQDKRKSSRAITRFLDEPRRLFITVLFGNTLVNMAFVSIAGALIYNDVFQGKYPGLAYLAAILIETFLLLIFGEITPKTYAIHHSESFARTIAQPLWLFSIFIYPFRKSLRLITDILLPLFGVKTIHEQVPLTREEIRAVIQSTEKDGALQKVEGEMIHNIFELLDIDAREIMVPRTRIVRISASKTIREVLALTKEFGHSRLPILNKNIDDICGIFYVKDWPRWKRLAAIESLGGRSVEELTIREFLSHADLLNGLNPGNENTLIRPPFYSINSKKISALIRKMTREKEQMAILLDEFGGVDGLVTVEDIVEEVVGEIFDEYDKATEMTIARDPQNPSTLLIPGYVSLRSINKRFGLKLDLSQVDTIGGYIISLFGAIPIEGDVVADKAHGIEFRVKRMDKTRIDLVQVSLKKDKPQKKVKKSTLSLLLLPLCFFLLGTAGQTSGSLNGISPLLAFLLLLLCSLIFSAFYSGSETAVVSASKSRIDILTEQKNTKAILIKKLWREPDRMLGIILVGNNLMNTAAGVAGLYLIGLAFPGREGLQETINTVVMTLIILIFCEILPKTIFRAKADSLALRSAQGLWISGILFRPIVSSITKITNRMVRMAFRGENEESLRAKREELKLLAKMGEREGALRRDQLEMIFNVLEMETMSVEKVMTPLVDIVCLPTTASLEDFFETATKTGFSRIPVYEDRVDNMVGLVNVLDVLYAETPSQTIAPFIRKDIRHEPETKRVYTLLREMGQGGPTMTFVVDEFGGIVGLVTIEDLIEEILGDIWDEKDRDESDLIRRIGEDIIECDGKVEIQQLNHKFNLDIPTGDYKTIAGYIISLLDRIPQQGELVNTETLKMTVVEADEKSVRRVQIFVKHLSSD
jgi:putative hemolysin